MKILLFSILMFITMEGLAYARPSSFNILNGAARDHAINLGHMSGTRGLGGGSVQSSTQTAESDSFADSSSDSSSKNLVQIQREVREVANAVHINAVYCGDVSGGSTSDGSFAIGGISYSCEVANVIAVKEAALSNILIRMNQYPELFNKEIAENRARQLQTDIYSLLHDDTLGYLQGRSNTAGWGAFARDTWMYWLAAAFALAGFPALF